MGVIQKYICKHCSFVADNIFEGFGWTVAEETFLCKECGNVMSAPIDNRTKTIQPKYSHCTKCKSTNLIPWDGKCPNCGSEEFESEIVGMWD